MSYMKLSSSAIPILGLLTWRPMAGYELKSKIEASLQNFWSESYGQLYPQLRLMSQSGLIAIVDNLDVQAENKRPKRVYRITQKGRDALYKWIEKEPRQRPLRNELLLKIFFATEGDLSSVVRYCKDHLYQCEKKLRRYQSIRAQLEAMREQHEKARYWIMSVEYGITHTEAIMKWATQVIAELEAQMQQREPHNRRVK